MVLFFYNFFFKHNMLLPLFIVIIIIMENLVGVSFARQLLRFSTTGVKPESLKLNCHFWNVIITFIIKILNSKSNEWKYHETCTW